MNPVLTEQVKHSLRESWAPGKDPTIGCLVVCLDNNFFCGEVVTNYKDDGTAYTVVKDDKGKPHVKFRKELLPYDSSVEETAKRLFTSFEEIRRPNGEPVDRENLSHPARARYYRLALSGVCFGEALWTHWSETLPPAAPPFVNGQW